MDGRQVARLVRRSLSPSMDIQAGSGATFTRLIVIWPVRRRIRSSTSLSMNSSSVFQELLDRFNRAAGNRKDPVVLFDAGLRGHAAWLNVVHLHGLALGKYARNRERYTPTPPPVRIATTGP